MSPAQLRASPEPVAHLVDGVAGLEAPCSCPSTRPPGPTPPFLGRLEAGMSGHAIPHPGGTSFPTWRR